MVMFKSRLGLYIFVPCCVLLFAPAAHAASISYYASDSGATPVSSDFAVSKFDTSLGTLLSVQLEVTGNSFGGSNEVDNESTSGGNATLTIATDMLFTGPGALIVLVLPQEVDSGVLGADSDATPDYTGSDWFKLTGSSSSDYQFDYLTSVAGGGTDDVSTYEGIGTVQFDWAASVNTSNSIDVAPTAAYTMPTTFDFDATVTYTYDAIIPEPATLSLLAMGLGSVIWIRRVMAGRYGTARTPGQDVERGAGDLRGPPSQ
jgi:hypothetical protein